ncbi:alpha/beta fold hydrolase [Nocardioides sp. Bht2]|uniref:alpha/beta fold hydrolase n=1 Tax=Nocardioides sp. Bht2 TaxID=3392297 RepID=UPI0039B6AB25
MDQPSVTPVVLIAPAMGIGARFYRPLVESFGERGWTAIALPRRGFEQDQPPASRKNDWSYADEIDEITRAVAAQREADPERPVLVLGHSLGGQMAVGHALNEPPADGLITIGTSLPYHRDFPWGGPHLVAMAGLIVPALTAVYGYLPKPAFGGPGAKTLMREWARMVLTGRPPYPVRRKIDTRALVISLEGDDYAPRGAVDAFVTRLFEPTSSTRLHVTSEPTEHVGWVRSPGAVVDGVVTWWRTSSADRGNVVLPEEAGTPSA